MCSCSSNNCNCNSGTIPRGPAGPQGPQGSQGLPGDPNTLTIGNVDTGTAAASITGTSPNQVLNLTIPQGNQGAAGPNGTTRLYHFVGSNSGTTVTPNWQNLNSYTLPANTLSNNGDSIIISALHLQTQPPVLITLFGTQVQVPAYRRITFDSNNLTVNTSAELWDLTSSVYSDGVTTFNYLFRTTVELIRTSSNSATCKVLADVSHSKGNLFTIAYSTTISSGLDFTTTNVIEFDVLQNIASQSELKVLTIDLIKKV
jgi:hypothetical protein